MGKSLGAQLLAYRASGAVKRFHVMITHRTQTVGEHSHGVAMLVMLVEPNCSVALIKAALTHDFHERATGDMPSTAKWMFPGLAKEMRQAEYTWNKASGLLWNLTEYEESLLNFCDYMELMAWSLEELTMGNRFAIEAIDNISEVFEKMKMPNPAAAALYESMKERYHLLEHLKPF